jgi:hypothetical protein
MASTTALDNAIEAAHQRIIEATQGDYTLFMTIYQHIAYAGISIPEGVERDNYIKVRSAIELRVALIEEHVTSAVDEAIHNAAEKQRTRQDDINTGILRQTNVQARKLRALFGVD